MYIEMNIPEVTN